MISRVLLARCNVLDTTFQDGRGENSFVWVLGEFEEKTTEIGINGITVCEPETTTVSAFWRVDSDWQDGVSREWDGNIISRSWKKNDSTTSLTGPWSEGDRKRMIRKDIEGIASRIRGITRRAVLKDKSYCWWERKGRVTFVAEEGVSLKQFWIAGKQTCWRRDRIIVVEMHSSTQGTLQCIKSWRINNSSETVWTNWAALWKSLESSRIEILYDSSIRRFNVTINEIT